MEVVFYNGRFISSTDVSISINSRAFNYGDGFFETIKIINAKPFNFKSHFNRISCALTILKLQNCILSSLQEKIHHLIRENNIINGMVKVHISRSGSGKYLPVSDDLDVFMRVINSVAYQKNTAVSVCFYDDEFKTLGALSNIKSINSLVSVLSSIYARENNYDNAILLNINSNVVEASNANIYIVKNQDIYTPPLMDGCVDGTMRKWMFDQLDVIEKSISKDEVLNSDEVFLTNASDGFTSVINIDGEPFSSSKNADLLQQRLINLSSDS